MPQDIASLASGTMLYQPVRVEVTPQSTTVEKVNRQSPWWKKEIATDASAKYCAAKFKGSVLVFTLALSMAPIG